MSMKEQAHQDDLVEYAKALVEQLESGEAQQAMRTIHSLHEQRDHILFQEVGKLTRSLHESIKNFAIDTSNSEMREEMSRMQDASERLNYVIEKTEQAANKTMDMVEHTMPVSAHLRETATNLKEEWDRLMRREMSADEFRQLTRRIDGFLLTAVNESTKIDSNLSSIMLAQDYQDLTGQVIKRVIELVREVEDSLVSLVSMASSIDKITGVSHESPVPAQDQDTPDIGPEGPIIDPSKRDDVVSSQDDVDALLSSLGF